MRTFSYHLVASLWRRKGVLLLFLAVFGVSMVLLQYHSVHDDDHSSGVRGKLYNNGQRTLRTFEARGVNASDRLQQSVHMLRSAEQHQQQQPAPASDELRILPLEEETNSDSHGKARPYDRKVQQAVGNKAGSNSAGQNLIPSSMDEDAADDVFVTPERNVKKGVHSIGYGQVVELTRPNGGQKLHHNHDLGNIGEGGGGGDTAMEFLPKSEPYVPLRRLVHLDLKGAPPKIVYLQKLIPILKQLGATGLLVEYEDMFPYEGPLRAIAARNHYSKKEVKSLLQLAKDYGLDVIPLVQTFGHMEFVLKLDGFQHLREVPAIPQAVCPSRNESFAVIQRLIDQVMEMHKESHWLHIGCDEVFQLGVCSLCNQHPREDVFLSHVARVARYVRTKYNVIPIVWDDMFHHVSAEQLRKYDMGSLVEPMLWTYVADIYRFISSGVWSVYAEVFPYIWAASAYKGAFGETLTVPDVKRHLENNMAWVEVLDKERSRFQEVRGIAITGWQRYDHFAVLCELLPAAIPSLAINVLATSRGYFNESLQKNLYGAMQCMKSQQYTTFVDLERDPYLWAKMSWCFFPGVSFFKATEHLSRLRTGVAEFLKAETVHKAWLTEYNVRRNFSSGTRIDATMQDFPRYLYDVETLLKQSRDALREVYDEYTVAEWIEQNVYPLLRKLELLQRAADALKRLTTWPVRPFETLPDLQRFNIGIPDDSS